MAQPQIQTNTYYWLNGRRVYVTDLRQHGNVEIIPTIEECRVLVHYTELRQCTCEWAGQHHSHGSRKVRLYRVARPRY